MADFFSLVFSKYGVVSILAFGISVCFVWLIAHRSAAQGTTVSVLWGLVQYTKKDDYLSKISKEKAPGLKESELASASISAPQITSLPARKESADFHSGRNLKALEAGINPEFPDRDYIGFSFDWLSGVEEGLKNLTISQRTRRLQFLVGEKWAQIQGTLDDVAPVGTTGRCVIVIKHGESRIFVSLEEDTSKTAEILHRGDTICVHAKFSPEDLRRFWNGSNLERVSKDAQGWQQA